MMLNDLMLREEGASDSSDQDLGDFYSNNPGDVVSETTTHRRNRRTNCGFGFVCIGALLILVGVVAAFFGKGEEVAIENEMKDRTPLAPMTKAPRPVPTPKHPTEPPTTTPTPKETTEPPTTTPETSEPTPEPHSSREKLFLLLSEYVDSEILLDPESIPYAASNWLIDNINLVEYDNTQIKQRFAIACLYYATNAEDSWEVDDGWMSDDDECTWFGVGCGNGKLIALDMKGNGLEGLIPDEIALLSEHLLSLELSDNDLVNTDEELAWIGELTKLKMLAVEDTLFAYDGVPPYIAELTDLRILDVATTLFYGELDGAIFAPLQELIYLELGDNWYNSSLPDEIAELPKLEALYAYGCGLEGDLEFAPKMKSLFELWIDDNPDLIGTIPTEIGVLTDLASLSISDCALSGEIPSEIGQLIKMEQMWLFGNWLSGTIPSEIGLMTELLIMGLEDNNITDTSMPQEICDLDLIALGADCSGDWDLECDCCSCCELPCPLVNIPLYNSTRHLSLL